MPRAEDDRLDDEAEDDEELALAEALADQRRAGDRHGAEERFFPEPAWNELAIADSHGA